MSGLLDILDAFNFIDRAEGYITSVMRADWKTARKKGKGAILAELGRALAGGNAYSFAVPRDCGWSGASIEQFLNHYGIKTWGRRVTSQSFHFSVEERQANWAEYLLLRRGIPVTSQPKNIKNAEYAEEHAPGDRPPAWADGSQPARAEPNPQQRAQQPAPRPAATRHSPSGSRLARLSRWLDDLND